MKAYPIFNIDPSEMGEQSYVLGNHLSVLVLKRVIIGIYDFETPCIYFFKIHFFNHRLYIFLFILYVYIIQLLQIALITETCRVRA